MSLTATNEVSPATCTGDLSDGVSPANVSVLMVEELTADIALTNQFGASLILDGGSASVTGGSATNGSGATVIYDGAPFALINKGSGLNAGPVGGAGAACQHFV